MSGHMNRVSSDMGMITQVFAVGDRIEGKCSNGEWCGGEVLNVLDSDVYKIAWDDENVLNECEKPASDLRLVTAAAAVEPVPPLKSSITAEQFLDLLEDEVVTDLLDELGVADTDPCNYVEAFDASGDGLLSTTEFVRGLLKLRG